ncbi:MAG: endo-1,4-beta-xylanase [Prolixibacteraceae bacterium]
MKFNNLTFLFILSALFISSATLGQEKFLGCAWSSAQNSNFQTYWNQVTPENGGKWGSVEGTRGVMRWSDMDAAYNLAQKYDMIFKEHTLIWGAQQPSWIGALDTASQRKEIEQWFSLLAARYPNIDYIDVVNEPLHNAPNGMLPWGSSTKNVDYAKALGGAGKTGWDWVLTSFRMARKYFPNSKLILNEYSVINSSTTTKQYVGLIKLLQADSLIDGIGEQAHAFTTSGASSATLKTNLDALAATGLPIYITEMDIDGSSDLVQIKEMQRVFKVFWDHPSVKGITMWGFRPGMWRTDQGANLVTQTGAERPALTWMNAYAKGTLILAESIDLSIKNDTSFVIPKGVSVTMQADFLPAGTTIKNVTWSVSPSSLAKIDATGKLTALATGTITVTATSWDGSGIKGVARISIVTPTSISNPVYADKIKVYPNPSNDGIFTIDGIENFIQIEVFDLTGRKVYGSVLNNQSQTNMQLNVPGGIYVISLFDGEQTVRKKIVIN